MILPIHFTDAMAKFRADLSRWYLDFTSLTFTRRATTYGADMRWLTSRASGARLHHHYRAAGASIDGAASRDG